MGLAYTILGACILHLASSEVQHFQSSLATTGRRHPCRGEQLMFTCEVVGPRLDWRVDSIHRARYFDTNRVDDVRTVNGPSIKFRSILTNNEEVTGTTGMRRLTSTLIAEVSESSTTPHNISCSSDSDTWLYKFQIAEVPQAPESVEVISGQSSEVLTIRWNAPVNADRFDFELYKIQVLSLEQDERGVLNVTSPKLEYPFGLIMNFSLSQSGWNNVSVSVISKCSQQGPEAAAPIISLNPNPNNHNLDVSAAGNFNSTTTHAAVTTITAGFNGSRILQATVGKAVVASTMALLTATMM